VGTATVSGRASSGCSSAASMGGAALPESFDGCLQDGFPFVGKRGRPPLRDQVPGDVLQRDAAGRNMQAPDLLSVEVAMEVNMGRGIRVVGPGRIAVVLPADERRSRRVVGLEPVAIGNGLAMLAAARVVHDTDHLLSKQSPRCSGQLQGRVVTALQTLDEEQVRLPRYLDQGKA